MKSYWQDSSARKDMNEDKDCCELPTDVIAKETQLSSCPQQKSWHFYACTSGWTACVHCLSRWYQKFSAILAVLSLLISFSCCYHVPTRPICHVPLFTYCNNQLHWSVTAREVKMAFKFYSQAVSMKLVGLLCRSILANVYSNIFFVQVPKLTMWQT